MRDGFEWMGWEEMVIGYWIVIGNETIIAALR